jgi:ADP-heptose:LPS heptosyltransferase
LIYSISGIGNSIRTLPLIYALYTMNYEVHVVFDQRRGTAPLFSGYTKVKRSYDCFDHSYSTNPYTDVFHCSYQSEKNTPIKKKVSHHVIPPFKVPPELIRFKFEKHETEYYLDLARSLGYVGNIVYELPVLAPPVPIPEKSVAISIGYFKGDPYSYKKHWGNDNFVKLARILLDRGYTPVFVGAKADWDVDGHKIASQVSGPLYLFNQNLLSSFGVVKECIGYIGNETCMVCASAALHKPTLSMIMNTAEPTSICPMKNYPLNSGLAVVGDRYTISPEWACDKLISLINGEVKERISYL